MTVTHGRTELFPQVCDSVRFVHEVQPRRRPLELLRRQPQWRKAQAVRHCNLYDSGCGNVPTAAQDSRACSHSHRRVAVSMCRFEAFRPRQTYLRSPAVEWEAEANVPWRLSRCGLRCHSGTNSAALRDIHVALKPHDRTRARHKALLDPE